jgi:hypothetical protein
MAAVAADAAAAAAATVVAPAAVEPNAGNFSSSDENKNAFGNCRRRFLFAFSQNLPGARPFIPFVLIIAQTRIYSRL